LLLGDAEQAARVVGFNPLLGEGEQQNIGWDALPEHLAACIQRA
jgi:histidyl-tRNA synthetase